MQPTYLYTSELDKEIRWRSKFPIIVPILLGIVQMLLTFIIIGLETVSVVISPTYGTLFAGFWCSVFFTLSWIFMLGLVCCHRSRKCATYAFVVSLICAGFAITLIVLDALFIGNIGRCFFTNSICRELQLSNNRPRQPVGNKVRFVKGQLTCAVLMLVTALIYMLLFIYVTLAARRPTNRVLIERDQLPPQVVRQTVSGPVQPQPGWKSTTVPVTYEPSQLECPHCGTLIKLAQKKRYT